MTSSQPDETSSDRGPAQVESSQRPDESWRWAIEASGAGTWTWDARANISTWDESFRALYGIAADAPCRIETWLEQLHPDDRLRLSARLDRLRTTPGDDRWSEVFRSVSADGRVRWHQGIGQVYRDAAGAPLRMAGIDLDITARKEAEDAARDREAQLDLVVRHYPGMVARLDRDLRYRYVSPRYEEWFGVPASTMLGRTMADIIGARAFGIAEPFALRALAGEAVSFENEIVLPTGRRLWVQANFVPVPVTDGAVPGFFVFAADITERKRAETALRESEEQLRALVRASSDVVFRMNADWSEARRLVGRDFIADTDEPPQTWLQKYIHPDDRPHVMATITEAIRTRSMFDLEHRVVRVDGSLGWTHSRAIPVLDSSGAIAEWFGMASDVTARVHAVEVLRAAFDAMTDAVFVSDATGRFVLFNEAFATFHKFPSRAACAVTLQEYPEFLDVYHPTGELASLDEWAVPRALRGETAVNQEYHLHRKDTGDRWIGSYNLAPIRDAGGAIFGSVVIGRDITDRKNAETAIRALERQHREDSDTLRALLASSAQGVLSVTEGGVIQSVNPALASMLGWAPDELVGRSHDVLLLQGQGDRHRQEQAGYWAAPAARPMGNGVEVQALRRDGTTVPVEVSLAPIHTSRGREAFAFVTDVSDRRRAERERAAHLRELEHQAGVLRRLASQLTLAEQDARERLAKVIHNHLQQVLFSARLRHQRLVTRLADVIGSDAELMRQLGEDLDDAIRTTRSLVAELFPPMLHDAGLAASLTWLQGWAQRQYGLTVDLEADPDANPAARDVRTLVFESVKELVFNAVKHAGVDRLAIDLALTPSGDVRLVVADGGAGFESEDLLATGRTQGTGFGLLAIRERLASLGGRLDVETAPGRGSRFTLTVPRGTTPAVEQSNGDETAVPTSDSAAADVARGGRPLRIVLADDHALVRDGLRQLLADHPGLQVVGEAADGSDAVALVRDLRPDVVIMDVVMPRMDGVEATRRIRTALPHLVVLGHSTEKRSGGVHPIEEAGASGYFAKGDDVHGLLDRLLELQASVAESTSNPSTGEPLPSTPADEGDALA